DTYPVFLQTRISGQQNSVVLQKLKPDAPYTITLSSLCPDADGGLMMGRCKTKPLSTVRNYRVHDPATSTLNVRWDHVEGNPDHYKLFCAPTAVMRGLARNVQMYNPMPNSRDVGWTLPLASAAAPRVCASLAGMRALEPIVVPGNTHTGHLEQLITDTPYSGNIIALHLDGGGIPALPRAPTHGPEILSTQFPCDSVRKAGQVGGEGGVLRAASTLRR
ncbi:Collagen alpha-1 chain, partial [Camelus dromedarius]